MMRLNVARHGRGRNSNTFFSSGAPLHARKGTTLVEMIVSITLLLIFLAVLMGMLGPFVKIFTQVQAQNHAQTVADTILETMRGELARARSYVKLYPADGVFTGTVQEGAQGAAIEFENLDGYIVLIDAKGCAKTELWKRGGKTPLSTEEEKPEGQLLMRYFTVVDNANNGAKMTYNYQYAGGGPYMARALTTVYGDGFYVGNEIRLTFALGAAKEVPEPGGTNTVKRVDSVTVTVDIVADNGTAQGNILCSKAATMDMVNAPQLRLNQTAKAEFVPPTG